MAPLDWGLGHATRCIPIIAYLHSLHHEVFIAAESAAAKLLKENFPNIQVLHLKGYRIQYSKKKRNFSTKIIAQIPKILNSINQEQKWLKSKQELFQFDCVISDNRYGLLHKEIPSVILTHQLSIQSGKGKIVDAILRKMHYALLNKFKECWIVDYPLNRGISGNLAHPRHLPANSKYIGIISQFGRFLKKPFTEKKPNEILVLLSGPEPMRSILEEQLITQIHTIKGYKFIIVGGNPLGAKHVLENENIEYYNYLTAEKLMACLENAKLVICRSGYSTIMDLAILNKNAVLIPTPGQTEQEYLAKYLNDNNLFFVAHENDIQLSEAIISALPFPGFTEIRETPHVLMKQAIDAILEKIQKQRFCNP